MPWQTIHELMAIVLLLAVLVLIILRPYGLDIAWSAGIGALLAIVFGLVPLQTLISIFRDTWDATITLIALFLLSQTLDSNGFFNWAALSLARFARGSGWCLYGLVFLLTLAVVALLANDGAVLMLTPIFARLLKKIYPHQSLHLPFFFATGLFADTMSILFIPSNLTNIIIADANQLGFLSFATWMLLPTLAAFLVGGSAFAFRLLKAPWNILIYALGMFVVITVAYEAQTLNFLINPLIVAVHSGVSGALASGSIVAFLSAAVNNLPATLVSVLALQATKQVSHISIYAIIIGVNIGPKLTPFGSLATLLWLNILKEHDIRISWGTYIRENWWVVLLTLFSALGALLLVGVFLR